MNYRYLIISILIGIGAYLYYFLHKKWLNYVRGDVTFFKPDIKFRVIKDWIIIIFSIFTSIVFFLKSIN